MSKLASAFFERPNACFEAAAVNAFGDYDPRSADALVKRVNPDPVSWAISVNEILRSRNVQICIASVPLLGCTSGANESLLLVFMLVWHLVRGSAKNALNTLGSAKALAC